MAQEHQQPARLVGRTQPGLRDAFLAIAAPLPRRPAPGWIGTTSPAPSPMRPIRGRGSSAR